MGDADEMTHDYAAAEMVAADDCDRGDAYGESDSDHHDACGDDEMVTVCGDSISASDHSNNSNSTNRMDMVMVNKILL